MLVLTLIAGLLSAGSAGLTATAAFADESPTGCDYATSGAGQYKNTICWINFANYSEALATSSAGQPFTVSLGGGYTATFTLTSRPVAGRPYEPTRAYPNSDLPGTGFAQYYGGLAGSPVLWNYTGGSSGSSGVTYRLNNIAVTGPGGVAVQDYRFVSADAESTFNGETVTFESNRPLQVLEAMTSTGPAGPSDGGCTLADTTVSGNTSTCIGRDPSNASNLGSGSNILLGSTSPTFIQQTINSDSRNAGAFGFMMSKVRLSKSVAARVNAADSFALNVSSGPANLGSADTGSSNSATTGPLTILAGNPVTLSESGSGSTDLSGYSKRWSCTLDGQPAPSITPADGATTATIEGSSIPVGSFADCTVTNTPIPKYRVEKSVDKQTLRQGDVATYTVTVTNETGLPYTNANPASFSDDLSKVLDDATYNNDASNGAAVNGNQLSWSGALGANETKTITYSVTVNNPDTGDHQLDNAVTPTGDGGECDVEKTCVTSTPVQSFEIKKSVDADRVFPGQKVTYTVTLENTGKVAYTDSTPAAFTDDLSQVTDDATYNNDATNGATVNGNTLSWSGPLAISETKTITYSFTVNTPDTGDKKLDNQVTPNDPTACTGQCKTSVPGGSYTTAKSVDKSSVKPGETVTYTVTVKNTGNVDYTDTKPASFTDDLSKVTDDATYVAGSATNGATVDGNTLSWKGTLAQGETKTITYQFAVNDPDTGDHQLDNAITPDGPGGECAGCITSTPVQSYSVAKNADKSVVQSGDTITYTVTVTNTGKVAYTDQNPASITDDLSGVTDDATYVAGSATNGAQVNGNTLTWSGPLDVGATQTITYKFTVNTPDTGDKRMENAVTPPADSGGKCLPTPEDCVTNTPVTSYEITKAVDKTTSTNGDTVTWTVSVKNTGEADVPAKFSDSLADVVDDATYNNDQQASIGTVDYQDGSVVWSGTVPVGQTATITYSATVNSPDTGNHDLANAVTPIDPPPGTPPVPPTSTLVKEFMVAKTVSEQAANPGDTVTYTLKVVNTGKVDYTAQDPATLSDDLSDVVDDATWNGDQAATAGTVTYQQPKLDWSGPVAVGDTVTLTYSVKVNNPDTGNRALKNTVASPGCFGSCKTVTPVRSFTITKQVDKTDARPGDKVTYTVTVTNTGEADYTSENPAAFTDDMSKVIDDATYNGDATATTGTVSYQQPKLNWSGPITAGKSMTVTYSVTVNNPDNGDRKLDNSVVPNVPGGDCTPDGCITHTTVKVPPIPAGPVVLTGGAGAGQVWPYIGGGIAALGVLAVLALMGVTRRRRENGDSA